MLLPCKRTTFHLTNFVYTNHLLRFAKTGYMTGQDVLITGGLK